MVSPTKQYKPLKVFVLHGDKKSKYARLCGPKTNQTWPFDALRKAGFQIDAFSAASDWLIFKKRLFDWLRVPPSLHQFENISKLGPLGENALEMWDVPFDTNSNKIYIAFDTDQSYHFKGQGSTDRPPALGPKLTEICHLS